MKSIITKITCDITITDTITNENDILAFKIGTKEYENAVIQVFTNDLKGINDDGLSLSFSNFKVTIEE